MSAFSEAIDIYGECPEDSDAQSEWLSAIGDGAAQFLRGGGRLTLHDWCRLSPEERAVFAVVGDKLDAKRAVLVAKACRSHLGELSVAAVFDSGDGIVADALLKLLDKMEPSGE